MTHRNQLVAYWVITFTAALITTPPTQTAAETNVVDVEEDSYQSREGHPADHLPPHIQQVSGFGERPEWSIDGKRILFVDKPMGEVYELDLETRLIHPKTRHFHHYGFTRANYLANGDILLSGPRESFDLADREARNQARHHCWLSVMPASGDAEPVQLGTMAAEGPAVSRGQMRIAWTHRDKQDASLGENHARHFVADIIYENGRPTLSKRRVVFDSHQLPFALGPSSMETQDFAGEDDRQLIFSVYQIENGHNTDTYIVDTVTGEYRNLTRSPNHYDEPEGVFPDGLHTCVEHAPCEQSAWPLTDIYKLKLDGSGEMQRLTYFSDFKGFKATQGVVSDDGKKLCFQIGKSGDEAGVGYGFFVMDLDAAEEYLERFRSYAKPIQPDSDSMGFRRIEFPMPERCDRAFSLDFDGDGNLDLIALCQTKIISITLPERRCETIFDARDGQTIHGSAWDADGDGDEDILFCRFQPGEPPSDYCLAWLELPERQVHPLGHEIRGVHGVAVGDLDGDAHADVVSANVNGNELSANGINGLALGRAGE